MLEMLMLLVVMLMKKKKQKTVTSMRIAGFIIRAIGSSDLVSLYRNHKITMSLVAGRESSEELCNEALSNVRQRSSSCWWVMLGLVGMLMALLCVRRPCENRATGSTTLKKSAKSFDWTVLLARARLLYLQ